MVLFVGCNSGIKTSNEETSSYIKQYDQAVATEGQPTLSKNNVKFPSVKQNQQQKKMKSRSAVYMNENINNVDDDF